MKFPGAIAHNMMVQGHATWLCARDPELGLPLRLFALMIAGYALSPIDLIPDFIPIIGLLDDAILLPLGIWLFRRWVPVAIFDKNMRIAEAAANRPTSVVAATAIVALWLALAFLAAFWLSSLIM